MSRTRESLFAAALVLCAPWAMADTITVNTTTDDFTSNTLCSLREAVEYFNRDKPEGGFQGCVSANSDDTAVVELPENTQPYLIEGSAITIGTALTINGKGRTGALMTTVQVVGAHRAFVVNYNPQYVAPRCATIAPPCASAPALFNLDSLSDSGVAGDFLTSALSPNLVGELPGVTPPLTGVVPAHSYVIRIYDNPKTGARVKLGEAKVPFSEFGMPWEVRAQIMAPGVHKLTYTLQEVDSVTNVELGPEGDAEAPTLTLALFKDVQRQAVRISQVIIKGGCATATGCAGDVDDTTAITNDPTLSNASYNVYGLSYTKGLTGTDGKGGIIFNNENLTLSDVLLRDGQAAFGGAVYLGSDAGLRIEQSDVRNNHADQGAAIYAEFNSLAVDTSLFTENEVTGAGTGAAVEVASPTLLAGLAATRILNSTFSANLGRALSLRSGAAVNVSTIVLNTGGGIRFNNEDIPVYNTILVGNGGSDCELDPAGVSMGYNLVLAGGSCPGAGNQTITNLSGPEQLMATEVGGRCASLYGILCPLADHGGPTPVHLPRLLQDYDLDPLKVGASPIINKANSAGSGSDLSLCPGSDQRGNTRSPRACDIGAVEMQEVLSGSVARSGGKILWGQTYSEYLGDELADEMLLPASKCPAAITAGSPAASYAPPELLPDISKAVPDSYRPDVDGCPWLESLPIHGQVTLDSAGNYHYVPDANFHGFDLFDVRVVTTLSNLEDLTVDRSRQVTAQVVVEPNTSMTSSKLGGVFDGIGLLVLSLVGLVLRRGGKA